MLKLFEPNLYIKSFEDLDLEILKDKGITFLICDIDNTLVAFDVSLPNDTVKNFVKKVLASNIKIVLISNNVEERVKKFATPLQLEYYAFANKPLKKTYRKVLSDYKLNPKHVAIIGDQLLTDIFGGNRMGFYSILTTPVAEKDLACTKINRFFENGIFKLLAVKKRLRKGEYDV